jgi:membrane protease YdiL (CAAX protease family)
MTFIRRHPLVSFFALAYVLSWGQWIPLALLGERVMQGSRATHFPGLLGPAIAAFGVTAICDGRTGAAALARRLILVSRPVSTFLLYALSPLAFLGLALVVSAFGGTPIVWRDFGIYSGLPPLGAPLVMLLVLIFNGFGEETGWRGFALEPLQRRYGPLGGTLVLGALWAAWHAPLFFIVDSYRQITGPMVAGGFGLGIAAGALVLTRVSQRTGGSVLAAALWHSAYNMTSGTAASAGVIAAVTTTCVMVWATMLLALHVAGRWSVKRGYEVLS